MLRENDAFIEKPVSVKALLKAVSLILFGHMRGPETEAEDIISSNGEVFERVPRDAGYGFAVASGGRDGLRRSVGRAHINIRIARAAGTTTSERRKAERKGVGTIRFHNQGPLGVPLALIGKQLTMRLDDGRTLDFMLCDSGNIIAVRVTNCQQHQDATGCGSREESARR